MIRNAFRRNLPLLVILAAIWNLHGCSGASRMERSAGMPQPRQPTGTQARPEAEPAIPDTGKAASPTRSSPAEAGKPPLLEKEATDYVHMVRWEGETLSLISQWYTDSWRNWEAIAGANPGIDPNRIRIGDRIRIPEALLRNRQPLPVDAISPSASRPEPKNPSGQRPALRAEEPEMFAPPDVTGGRQAVPKDPELFEPEEIAGKKAERDEADRLFGPVE